MRWVIAVLVLVFGLVGCAAAEASIADDGVIVVGVKADQPGLGFRQDRVSPRGFEVDVRAYIARQLGASRVTFREVRSDSRERS